MRPRVLEEEAGHSFARARTSGSRPIQMDGSGRPSQFLAQAGNSFPGPWPGCGLGAESRGVCERLMGRGPHFPGWVE